MVQDATRLFRPRTNSFFDKGFNSEGHKDLREFLISRGLGYDVAKHPALVHNMDDGGVSEVPNQFHLRRQTDGYVLSKHTVSSRYSVISPLEMVEDLQPYIDEGFASIESAWTMDDDRIECVALRLGDNDLDDRLGEKFRTYLFARNVQGDGAITVSLFAEREVCSNGMTILDRQSRISLRHTGRAVDRYKAALQRYEDLRKTLRRFAEEFGLFVQTPMSYAEMTELTNRVLGIKNIEDASGKTQKIYKAIMDAFNMPTYGTNGKSAWDAYNAVTYVGSHYTGPKSPLTTEAVTEGLLRGSRGNREARVFRLLEEFAGAA